VLSGTDQTNAYGRLDPHPRFAVPLHSPDRSAARPAPSGLADLDLVRHWWRPCYMTLPPGNRAEARRMAVADNLVEILAVALVGALCGHPSWQHPPRNRWPRRNWRCTADHVGRTR